MASCFNCGSDQHFSRNCDKPQRFTRCPLCDNVCTGENSHKIWCTQRQFVSQLLDPSQPVVPPGLLFRIGFNGVTRLVLVDTEEKPISNVPLFLPTANVVVYKDGSRVVVASFGDKEEINLNVLDKHNTPVVFAEISNNALTVNDRYNINNGNVRYDATDGNAIVRQGDFALKAYSEDTIFKTRFYLNSGAFTFDVYWCYVF